MRPRFVAVVALALAAAPGARAAPPDQPYTVYNHGESREETQRKWEERVAPYVRQARATYAAAKERYLRGLPAGQKFFVSYVLTDATGVREQVFIRVDRIVNGTVTGRINSDLDLIHDRRQGDTVTFPESDVRDWMISHPGGTEEGNFVGKFIDTLNQAAAPPPMSAPAPPPVSAPAPPPKATPTQYQSAVVRAEHLGRMMYLHYRAMTIGEGALLNDARPHNAVPVGGAVVVQDPPQPNGGPASFTVSFFTRDKDPRVAYRVHIPFVAGAAPTIDDVTPPEAPSAQVAAIYRAEQSAQGAIGAREQLIDTVVLPAKQPSGEDGFLVYLVASTKKADVAVLGRHHRVVVSGDGRQVLRVEPLSKAILELPMSGSSGDLPPGARAVALTVTHVLNDTPIETHVFATLRYGIPIDVVTKAGSWHIERGRITYLGPSATAGASPI